MVYNSAVAIEDLTEMFESDGFKTRLYKKVMEIQFNELAEQNPELADWCLDNSWEFNNACKIAIESIPNTRCMRFRAYGLPSTSIVKIRDMRQIHIGKLICIEGIIRVVSTIRPMAEYMNYKCNGCDTTTIKFPHDGIFWKPKKCACGSTYFKELPGKYYDAQRISVEEPMDLVEGGKQPQRVNTMLTHELASFDKNIPGMRVIVVGSLELKKKKKERKTTEEFDWFFKANSIVPLTGELTADMTISDELLAEFKEFVGGGNPIADLRDMIAPDIVGHEDVKQAMLFQMAGGIKVRNDDGRIKRVGDIHLLLVSDPGLAKSRLGAAVQELSPRSRYVDGKGASGVGLTASVVKDELMGGFAVEAGAIVLAHEGILAIDEFDKMPEDDRRAMHVAMTEQIVQKDKANVHVCYDESTEVLTEKGWKRYDESVGLKIAQYDTHKDRIEFVESKGIYMSEYSGKMHHYSGKRVDICVTPDHKMLVKPETSDKFRLIPSNEISSYRFNFLNASEVNNRDIIGRAVSIPGAYFKQKREAEKYLSKTRKLEVPTDLLMKFIGIYVTDGCLTIRKSQYALQFTIGTKAKEEYMVPIIEEMARLTGAAVNRHKSEFLRLRISDTRLGQYIESVCGVGKAKTIPRILLTRASLEQLRLLFEAAMICDGSKDGKGFTSVNKDLAETMQIIGTLTGKSVRINKAVAKSGYSPGTIYWRLGICDNREQTLKRKLNLVEVDYDGKIWCHSVPSGVFVTRRNGKVAIQGNTMKAETAILALANPKHGRFDSYTTLAEQLNLEPSLINRFDLIFAIKDEPNEKRDREIFNAIMKARDKRRQKKVDAVWFKRFITYIKTLEPKMTKEADKTMEDFYVGMRKRNSKNGQRSIPISPRQGDTIVKLAQASARLHMSEKVESRDADYAICMMEAFLGQLALDKETGVFDVSSLDGVTTVSKRNKMQFIYNKLKELTEPKDVENVQFDALMEKCKGLGIKAAEMEETLEKLRKIGDIYEPRPGVYAPLG